MTRTKSNRTLSLLDLFDMQTKFFHSALDGVADKDAQNRLNTKANHIAWLAGSLVQQRFDIANLLGVEGKQKAHDLFDRNQGIKDDAAYPPLAQYRSDWDRITPSLRNALVTVSDETLDENFEMGPEMKMTNYELISFIIYREANCIGQIALWRRLLGYEAMKYM